MFPDRTGPYVVPLPGGAELRLGKRTLVMGVLNVTPDSFSDGGQFHSPEAAVDHAYQLVQDGADLLDVGAESTRPGAPNVPAECELNRLMPVLDRLVGRVPVPISVDTNKAVVARAVLSAGAAIINDIRGLADPEMAAVVAEAGAALVVMHCPVEPAVMARPEHHRYGDLFGEIADFLAAAIQRAQQSGVPREAILIDPGIGFAKTAEQSAALCGRAGELSARLDRPVLLGPSRKSFIGRALAGPDGSPAPPGRRLWGTAAAVALGIAAGAHMIRVHDVAEMVQVARVADTIVSRQRLH